jgi:hypothetical protein
MRYLAIGALLAACGGSDGVGPTSSPRSVRLIPDTARIGLEATLNLLALDVDGRAIAPQALQWTSTDVAVAVVDPAGVVRGIAAGQVETRATTGAAADTARLTVLPFVWLGVAEPADINAVGTIRGSGDAQPFIWSPAGGLRRLTGLSGTLSDSVRGLADDGPAVGISGASGLETGQSVIRPARATVGISHDGRRIWIGTVWPAP